MDERPAPSPADRLRELLARPGPLVLPCPYDALSARLAVAEGFEAMFVGGYASVASRFGFPGIGLASATEMLETARCIVRAARGRPVLVDGDIGYGGDATVRRTVVDLAQAGADLLFMEAPRDEAEMRAFVAAAGDRPCLANMLEGGATPILPPSGSPSSASG